MRMWSLTSWNHFSKLTDFLQTNTGKSGISVCGSVLLRVTWRDFIVCLWIFSWKVWTCIKRHVLSASSHVEQIRIARFSRKKVWRLQRKDLFSAVSGTFLLSLKRGLWSLYEFASLCFMISRPSNALHTSVVVNLHVQFQIEHFNQRQTKNCWWHTDEILER